MEQKELQHQFLISRYMSAKGCQLGIPINGTFELTSRCNFHCSMCYVHGRAEERELKKRELTKEQWLALAEEAKKRGTLFLLLTGGEVMLREDFLELYVSLAKMGFRITINTNGSLLNEKILDCFRLYPPACINVSLYGGSQETYRSLCGVPAREQVTKSIHQLKRLGLRVRVTMTITPCNYLDIEEVCDFSRREEALLEMSAYMFPQIRLSEQDVGINQGRLTAEEAGRCTVRCERIRFSDEEFDARAKRRFQGEPYLSENEDEEHRRRSMCQAGRGAYWITWDGKMRPCGLMTEPEADLEEEGFWGAWQKIHGQMGNIRLPEECANCKDRGFCRVCAAMCQAETGGFERKPEYVCKMAEAMRKEYEEQLRLLNGGNDK